MNTPDTHDAFWTDLSDELAALAIAPELTPIPLHSNEFSDVYAARFTSVGPYRLFAYFSVPTQGDGPFPALLQLPGYGSVVHVPAYELRQQYVVLTLRHRGQRLADQPYAAAFPGLLTDGVEDAETYVYRGIAADCLRAADFLLSREEVNRERIAVVGNDLALITAARRPSLQYLYYTPGPFHQGLARAAASSAYPLEEWNDYLRSHPESRDRVEQTIELFDPIHQASSVKAETLVVGGAEGDPLVEQISGSVSTYASAHSGYKDGVHQMEWLADRLGVGEPALPAQWQ